MTNVKFFLAVTPDSNIVSPLVSYVANHYVGILPSFTYFKNQNLDGYKKTGVDFFADCGAFSVKASPRQYWNGGLERLIEYYRSTDFAFITELDLFCPDFDARILLAARFARRLHSGLAAKQKLNVIRPIHGGTAKRRLEYLDEVARRSKVKVTNVALGAVDVDFWHDQLRGKSAVASGTKRGTKATSQLEQIAVGLAKRGVRKVHFFGASSNNTFYLLKALREMNLFEQVSADSSSYAQGVINGGKVFYFDKAAGRLAEATFSLKWPEPSENEIKPLRRCKCPACTRALHPDEDGKANKVVDLGLLMLRGGSRGIFTYKAQIHNAYQILLLTNYLNTRKSP